MRDFVFVAFVAGIKLALGAMNFRAMWTQLSVEFLVAFFSYAAE